MFYFIPSWYQKDRPWYQTSQPFFRKQLEPVLDDVIQYVGMFQKAKEESKLLVLNYAPNLRHLLHGKELFEVSYWSLFDQIQGVQGLSAKCLTYQDLAWPEGTIFQFTPFVVLAMHKGQRLATIYSGQNGQLFAIDYFHQGLLSETFYWDDRGFVSSRLIYQEELPYYQEYFNAYGEWQFREFLLDDDKHIEVSPLAYYPFKEHRYASMTDLVKEVSISYIASHMGQDDSVFVSSDSQHNAFLLPQLGACRVLLSFYENRYPITVEKELLGDLTYADEVIVNRRWHVDALQTLVKSPITHISPYDARLRLGHSQQYKEQVLYVVVDGLPENQIKVLLHHLIKEVIVSETLCLDIVSYDSDLAVQKRLTDMVSVLINQADKPYLYLADEEKLAMFEAGEIEEKSRVTLLLAPNEETIIKHLDKARLILDLGAEPDLYTQIAGISAGLPQLNRVKTEFVEHGKNGYVVTSLSDLKEVMSRYLTGTREWNKALVYSVQKLANYTNGQIVKRLVLEEKGTESGK